MQMNTTKYFQVSLRGALCIVAIIAGIMAWAGARARSARSQADAARQIEALGGILQYDWEPSIGDWRTIGRLRLQPDSVKMPCPRWLRSLFGDAFFQTVEGVAIRGAMVRWHRKNGFGEEMLSGVWDQAPVYDNLEIIVSQLRRLDGLRYVYVDSGPRYGPSTQLQKKLAKALPHCTVIRSKISTVAATKRGDNGVPVD